jgi:hypothetical protein
MANFAARKRSAVDIAPAQAPSAANEIGAALFAMLSGCDGAKL